MKILVLKPHEKWAYNVGETGKVPDDKAEVMITAGYWKKLDEPSKQTNDTDTTKRKPTGTRRRKSVSKD